MTDSPATNRLFTWPRPHQVMLLVLVGLVAGFLSGMFGVGGGIIIVPALTMVLGYSPKLAAGTSLAAIVVLATVGVISYAQAGSVSWIGALLLAAGALGGAQVGSWLLARVSTRRLQVGFAFLMIFSAVMLFVSVPTRGADIHISWATGIALVTIGFMTGVLSGMMGVGGGIIVVPALMLVLGASDLMAKGTSLLMMIPSAISGTIPNYRRDNVDLAAALIVSLSACTTTVLGARVAQSVSPLVANICFAMLIVAVALQLLIKAWKSRENQG